MPRWPISFAFYLAASILVMLKQPLSLELDKTLYSFKTTVFALSSIFLLTRDILIAHYFHFGSNGKRATWTILFYYTVLYALIPGIFYLVHFYEAAFWFLPGLGHYPISSVLGPLVQVGAVGFLVLKRWRGYRLD